MEEDHGYVGGSSVHEWLLGVPIVIVIEVVCGLDEENPLALVVHRRTAHHNRSKGPNGGARLTWQGIAGRMVEVEPAAMRWQRSAARTEPALVLERSQARGSPMAGQKGPKMLTEVVGGSGGNSVRPRNLVRFLTLYEISIIKN